MDLFVYGTLMTAEGFHGLMQEPNERLEFRMASLPGWRRVWNAYREEWGGGVLNVEPAAGAEVVGMLVSGIPRATLEDLDEQEKTHLPRERVSVRLESGETIEADVYVLRGADYAGAPSPEYLDVVLRRARQVGPRVLESLLKGSVDSNGNPLQLNNRSLPWG